MPRLSSEGPGGGEEAAEDGNGGGGEEPGPQGATAGRPGQGGTRPVGQMFLQGRVRPTSCPQLPSCAKLAAWARAVLAETHPPANLDTKRLLSMVKKEDVQRLVKEKEALLARLEEMVEDQ